MSTNSEKLALAAVHYERGFDVDALLAAACARLRFSGAQLGGLLQKSVGDPGACSSVHMIDLRSGETFDIWESRGGCARGCRLDERGLIDAEPNLVAAIADHVDLLVINRFGRAESLGRGLTGVFSAAIDAGIPVLTAVRAPYVDAWAKFHGGLARRLPYATDAIVEWHSGLASGSWTGGPHTSISCPA